MKRDLVAQDGDDVSIGTGWYESIKLFPFFFILFCYFWTIALGRYEAWFRLDFQCIWNVHDWKFCFAKSNIVLKLLKEVGVTCLHEGAEVINMRML